MGQTHVDARLFRKAMATFPTGVTIVTTIDRQGVPAGLTVNTFSSLSLDPPMVLFCLDRAAGSRTALEEAGGFAVNILSEEQAALSQRFATRRDDRWQGIDWHKGPTGWPVFAESCAVIECQTADIWPGGDHLIFTGLIKHLVLHETRKPLLYHEGDYARIGRREV